MKEIKLKLLIVITLIIFKFFKNRTLLIIKTKNLQKTLLKFKSLIWHYNYNLNHVIDYAQLITQIITITMLCKS